MKINDGQLYDIDQIYTDFVTYYTEKLGEIKTAIDTFNSLDSIEGTTADTIKSYFSDTHKSLIDMMITYLEDAESAQEEFFYQLLFEVDDSDASHLDTEVLAKCATDFANLEESFISYTSKLHTAMDDNADLIDLNSVFTNNLGEQKYGAAIDKFEEIISTVEEKKSYLESVDEAGSTGRIVQVSEYRESISTLISELKDKQLKNPEEHWDSALEDYDSYEGAKEAHLESEEYLNSIENRTDYGQVIEDAHREYEKKETALEWDMVGNAISSVAQGIDGVKTIAFGLPFLANPITQPIGVYICGSGLADVSTAAYDLFAGTNAYYWAHKSGNVNFEYQSSSDIIVEEVFGGSEFKSDVADTTLGIPITFCEAYSEIDVPMAKKYKLMLAGSYTVLDLAHNVLLTPYLNAVVNDIYEQFTGNELGDGTSGAAGTVIDMGVGKLIEFEWDNI